MFCTSGTRLWWILGWCLTASVPPVLAPRHHPGHYTVHRMPSIFWTGCFVIPIWLWHTNQLYYKCDPATFCEVLQLSEVLVATQNEPFWGCGSLAHGPATLASFSCYHFWITPALTGDVLLPLLLVCYPEHSSNTLMMETVQYFEVSSQESPALWSVE